MILLITKYNKSPRWFQLIIFLLFYFILIKLHYFDFQNNIVDCMQKNNSLDEDEKMHQIVAHLKEKSTINSMWNDIRDYFNLERIDTATIDQPLKTAEF